MKGYDDIVKKITQHESVTNILLKYEYVLKSQNDSLYQLPNILTGPAVLITYVLAYAPLL